MTRQLHTLFNLPDDDDDENKSSDDSLSQVPDNFFTDEIQDTMEKIESSLPAVKGLESSDKEMDELADLAKEAFENLMDMGMQTDSRFAAEIFNSAHGFLGHSITAKTAKINKKLKMISLQLQKAELDRKMAAAAAKGEASPTSEPTQLGTGQVIDRNDLIRQILAESKIKANDK
jgi:hypothetical protein